MGNHTSIRRFKYPCCINELDSNDTILSNRITDNENDITAISTTWTITHNKNTRNMVWNVLDVNNMQIIPNAADASDLNEFVISFTDPQTGRINIMFYS